MASSFGEERGAQRAPDRRSEIRYDGPLAASFTYTPRGGSVRAASCTIVSLSPSAMVVTASVHGQPGEHLWVEVEGFGLIRCEIEQVREDGFVCAHLLNIEARRKLATWVSWLRRRGGRPAGDQRAYMRARPRDARTTIVFADGEAIEALVSDISRSGAAVSCDRVGVIGEEVQIGRVPAHVARVMAGGFAVSFDEVLEAADADRLVAGYEVSVKPSSKAI